MLRSANSALGAGQKSSPLLKLRRAEQAEKILRVAAEIVRVGGEQSLLTVEAPGHCRRTGPRLLCGLEVPDLISNVDELTWGKGIGAGDRAEEAGLSLQTGAGREKIKIVPELMALEEDLDVFHRIRGEDAEAARLFPQDGKLLRESGTGRDLCQAIAEEFSALVEEAGNVVRGDPEGAEERCQGVVP